MRHLLTIFLLLFAVSSFAQDKEKVPIGDRVMFWHGVSYSKMKLFPPGYPRIGATSGLGRLPHLNYSIGTYFMLLNSNDFLSLGINWGVGAGFNYDDGIQWKVQSPAFLMARIGAESSPYNSNDVGFGLGIGGNVTYSQYRQNRILQTPTTWLHPMLAFEYSAEIFTIRVAVGLSSPSKEGNFFDSTLLPTGTSGLVKSSLFSVGYFMEI